MTTKRIVRSIDVDSKQSPFMIIRDLEERNAANRKNHSAETEQTARSLRVLASEAWFRSRVFMNFRKEFITIKVDRPQTLDRMNVADQLKLERFLDENGIETVKTRRNIVYRVY